MMIMWTVGLLLMLIGEAKEVIGVRTWNQYIQTNTKYIIMGPTAISGDIVVPFLANRNNSMYSTALAMVGLNHYKFMDANGSGRYSVMVNNMTQAQTGLTIRVETYLNSGYAQWLGVRYLVVDLSFVYLSIHPFTLNYHNNPQAYGERSSSNLFSVDIYPTLPSYQASDRTKVMTAINGFDIQDSGGSNPDIEVEIQCIQYLNPPPDLVKMECAILNTYVNFTMYYQYIGFDVILYHKDNMKNTEGSNFISNSLSIPSATVRVSFGAPIDQTAVFYGVSRLTKEWVGYPSPFFFIITIYNNSTIKYQLLGYNQTASIFFINMVSIVKCVNSTLWNDTSKQCESCPLGAYFDSNDTCSLCTDLWTDCVECNNTTCFNCSSPLEFNGTHCLPCSEIWPNSFSCLNCSFPFELNNSLLSSTCFLCEDIWLGCGSCSSSGCSKCTLPAVINGTECFLCETVWPDCIECDNTTCLNCTSPLEFNGTDCFLCGDAWGNCMTCNGSTCLNCTFPFELNGTECFLCVEAWPGCITCSSAGCSNCTDPYKLNETFCDGNCTLIENCTACSVDQAGQLICLECSFGLVVSVQNECVSFCGDGVVIGSEGCDDNNTRNGDGCDKYCQKEEYFQCTGGLSGPPSNDTQPSICLLKRLDLTIVCIAKSEGSNQVILTLDLYPNDLVAYQTADWLKAFGGESSHSMTPSWAQFDSSTNRLRVAFAYHQNLQGESIKIASIFSRTSPHFSLSPLVQVLALPKAISNNQALYLYSDNCYFLASITKVLSMAVAGASLALLSIGYFGSKLQSFEGVAVAQVAALLLISVSEMGPTYSGLLNLIPSLGITAFFQDSYDYEDSTIPINLRPLLRIDNFIGLINIFLAVIIVPPLVAAVIKILSLTYFKQNRLVERAWKYSLGSFTYYGLLFLAYASFASLALNIRFFTASLSNGIGICMGLLFTASMTFSLIFSYRDPLWFGCFKKKFYKIGISRYFYLFSSGEQFVTAILIVSLSPGAAAAGAVTLVFLIEAIFILVKRPYNLAEWRRPFFNKLMTFLVCLFYVGASMTGTDSLINQIIPLLILLVLVVVLVVAAKAAVSELHEYWSTREEQIKAAEINGPPMSVEEGQNLLMRQFQQRMMPAANTNNAPILRQPVEHEAVDIARWRWDNYPVLYALDSHIVAQQRPRPTKKRPKVHRNNFQEQEREGGQEEEGMMRPVPKQIESDQI